MLGCSPEAWEGMSDLLTPHVQTKRETKETGVSLQAAVNGHGSVNRML